MITSPPPKSGLDPVLTTAAKDLFRGASRWDLWMRLGWLEILRRYRRTVIGPFWSAISLGLFVIALGSVGSGLWNHGINEYLPFLAAGFVVWVMIAGILTESCSLFLGANSTFGQVQLDYSILAYALVWRNFITFLHNFIVYLAMVLILAPHMLQPVALVAIPGLLLVMFNGIWVALLLGMFALRFRDIQQFVMSIVNIAMFVTPIFWLPDSLQATKRLVFVTFNPLFHLIDIVRAPLLGHLPSAGSYLAVGLITIVGWSVTFVVFHRLRKRIPYWG